MRLSLLLPCVVVAAMIGLRVFAQSGDEQVPNPVDPFASKPDPVDAETEDQKLRQQYLELIEQKSVHMDRSALREAISRAESDIDELKADTKLQEAKQLLLDLVKTHPETSAAQTARSMLQADTSSRTYVPAGTYEGRGPDPSTGVLPPTYDFGNEILPSNQEFRQPGTSAED